MSRRKIRVGMGQMLVDGGRPEANLKRATEMIAQAAAEKCDIVTLPEWLDLGGTFGAARSQAQPIPGEFSNRLAR